jgi:ribosomal protein S18 acetylase RimI-like enzyme
MKTTIPCSLSHLVVSDSLISFQDLVFLPISLERSFPLCFEFRRDTFKCSFGEDSRLWPNVPDPEKYKRWLQQKLKMDSFVGLHVWLGGRIVGQLELGAYRKKRQMGYLHFCYLTAPCRQKGLGRKLLVLAEETLRARGFSVARLCVSPKNRPAWSLYERAGWVDLGPNLEHPEVHYMEKNIKGTAGS